MNFRKVAGVAAVLSGGGFFLLVNFLLPAMSPDTARFWGDFFGGFKATDAPFYLGWDSALCCAGIALLVRNPRRSAVEWLLLLIGIGSLTFWLYYYCVGIMSGFPVEWSVQDVGYGKIVTSIPGTAILRDLLLWLGMLAATSGRLIIPVATSDVGHPQPRAVGAGDEQYT